MIDEKIKRNIFEVVDLHQADDRADWLNRGASEREEKVIRMGIPPMRLEILTSIDGVNFEECYKNRIIADFGDFTVNFISKNDLLQNKRSSGRPQDMVYLEKLQNMRCP